MSFTETYIGMMVWIFSLFFQSMYMDANVIDHCIMVSLGACVFCEDI